MSNSSFNDEKFSAISAQTVVNWFLVILQTAKLSTKNKSCYAFQDWRVENLFSLVFDKNCLAEGHTEAAMRGKWWLQKFDLRIFKSVTVIDFSTLKNFTKVETLVASGGIFPIISVYVVHTKIFV